MSTQVTLYTTAGCHLCEQAEAMLSAAGVRWESVDIAAEPQLMDAYGVRIPVIRTVQGAELGWPFGQEQLNAFLDADPAG